MLEVEEEEKHQVPESDWGVMKAVLTGWSTGLEWRSDGVTREQ